MERMGMESMDDIKEGKDLEFDWFPECRETDDYTGIMDLSHIAAHKFEGETEGEAEEEYSEIPTGKGGPEAFVCYDGGLEKALNRTFSSVHERLCGDRLEFQSILLSDCVEALNVGCEVIRSKLSECTDQEISARIEVCLNENGCVIAAVDNESWKELVGMEASLFMDSGIRIIEITQVKDDCIIVNDIADGNEDSVKVTISKFSRMNGLLLEVLK